MSMTEEKTTDRMQTGLQKEAAVQPEEKSKIVYEGGGNLARQQKKGKSLVLDDGRIEAMKEYLSPEELYQDLISRVRRYHPSDDISMIEKAYKIAYAAHEGQVRKSGEPYIIHPLCVAIILADLELDKETIEAGLLHDVVEDTIMTEEEIEKEFGPDVALLVDGVTKLQQINFPSDKGNGDNKTADQQEMQAENLRKMFLAMAKDIRVIMIKLADRLHNMRTLKYQPPAKQQKIARETMEIYAPIAQRLGISKIKVELDDLSLKYLEPDVYYDLVDKIAVRRSEREEYIQQIVDEVTEHMKNAGIKSQIDGRVKHFFSIYKKMKNQSKTLDQIYDLFAVRIIVDSVKDCYAALGVIHEMYKPFQGVSRTTSPCPSPTCTSHCTPRLSDLRDSPSKFRYVPWKCIRRRNTALPPTGNIRKPPMARRWRPRRKKSLHGCARSWNGSETCRTIRNL